MKLGAKLLLFFLVIGFALPVGGVETTVWQIADFKDFLQGRLNGVSISKDGTLGLAPEAKVIFNPDEALALSLAADSHRNLYIGTGHQGKVYRVAADGKSSLFFTAQEPDIFALAADPQGNLYVGSSPEGKIYRVTPEGKSSVFYDPHAKYIWALLFDSQGRLYVGTGDRGQILRVDRTGKGEVFFNSNQTHIMCLAFDHQGNLLAGSVPDGLVYRINPKGKAFVIYQAGLPEIHDLAVGPQGNIYAAALGAPGQMGTPLMLMPQTPAITIPTQVMTVTAETPASSEDSHPSAQKPKEAKPQKPEKRKEAAPSFIHPGETLRGIAGLLKSQSRGAVIEISPDSTAETLWNSNSESVYGLALVGKKILFSTDSNGQIYELDRARFGNNLTLLTETHESVATRLLVEGGNLYIATSNVAKLFRMGTTPSDKGTYESPVKDTNFISHWGVLSWRGETPPGTSVEFYTRSGNFKRPDQTWSDWAGPYQDPNSSSQITSPPARYIQWKAVFRGSGSAGPALDEASIAYLNQNLPPEIHSLSVSNAGERTSTASPSPAEVVSSVAISVAAPPNVSYPVPAPANQATGKSPVTLTWQADDPNGDSLAYSIYVKSTDEKSWHLVKDKIKSNSYTIDPSSLADGQYVARLVASDAPSNPPSTARQDVMLSAPFWVDNTPPEVSMVRKVVKAGETVVQFRAEDATSPLHNAQSSIDGHGWKEIESDDGIIDSRTETFTVKAQDLAPGEHVIALRAYDTAGNAGVGKAVVEIPGNRVESP
ncbi:MAG TPA: two-component regulator propeller domain-containing protein [Terriglobia bacterium]|nr:two-component regulator propeller domain-containing protein [Terriglobia bacterium]